MESYKNLLDFSPFAASRKAISFPEQPIYALFSYLFAFLFPFPPHITPKGPGYASPGLWVWVSGIDLAKQGLQLHRHAHIAVNFDGAAHKC
jgi:hypothetical protein